MNNHKCQCEYKKLIKHCVCDEDYAENPSTCVCNCDKDCGICEYLKDCECMKNLVDDLVVTCDEIEDTPESAVINPSNGTNYWLITVALLVIACLLLLANIFNSMLIITLV